jgi:hypothetical protein
MARPVADGYSRFSRNASGEKREGTDALTLSEADLISSTSSLYMGGTVCTGMLTRRSQKTKPTFCWLCGEKRAWRVSVREGSEADFDRIYSVNALIDGCSCNAYTDSICGRVGNDGNAPGGQAC